MKDYFLRADSRDTIDQALQSAGLLLSIEDELVPTVLIRYVDKVFRPTGAMLLDDDGNEYAEQAPVEGYHVNLRCYLTKQQQALLPLIDRPKNPQEVFA